MAEEAKKAPAPAQAAGEKKKVVGKPSALKRDQQSERKRLRNKSYRATVLTSVRSLENSFTAKDAKENVQTKLSAIYSLMDKGVKRGIFKPQKAARTKSRLAARLSK